VTDREERQQRRVKKLASKDLPYSLDSAKLLDMVPELDRERGLGRVLREVVEATQGNFDHMRSELKRNTDYHNEHAEETNFIKDEVIPHEHVGSNISISPGHNRMTEAVYFGGAQLPNGTFPTNYWPAFCCGYAVPVFFDKPVTITNVAVEVHVAGTQGARIFAYGADNEGGAPGTFLFDFGVLDCSSAPSTPTSATVQYQPPVGWSWLVLVGENVEGSAPELSYYDAGDLYQNQQQTQWPFKMDYYNLDFGTLGIMLSFSLLNIDDGVSTAEIIEMGWAGEVDNDEILYASAAPLILYTVE
jgi:hypothetical protein